MLPFTSRPNPFLTAYRLQNMISSLDASWHRNRTWDSVNNHSKETVSDGGSESPAPFLGLETQQLEPGEVGQCLEERPDQHRTVADKDWLTASKVPVFDWVSNFPNCNPIKNLWRGLKREVNKLINHSRPE